MNTILSADWHIGDYRNGPTINGVNGRLLDIQARMDEVLKYAEDKKADRMVLAGDMFRDKHPSMLHLEIFSKAVKRLIDDNIKTFVITGNHDVNRVRGTSHALTPFMPLIKNTCVEIIDQPTTRDDLALFPFMRSPQQPTLAEFLKTVSNTCRIMVLHGTVKGAILNKLVDYEIHDEDAVDVNMLDRFLMVWAGHIHDAQTFKNVLYPGSIERLDFGDEFSSKAFAHMTGDEIKKVPLNARKMTTVTYQILKDHYKELDLKGSIVKVVNADKNFLPDIRRMLAEKCCYYVAAINTMDTARQETATKEMLDTPKFVGQFAQKVKVTDEALIERSTRSIVELLEAQDS